MLLLWVVFYQGHIIVDLDNASSKIIFDGISLRESEVGTGAEPPCSCGWCRQKVQLLGKSPLRYLGLSVKIGVNSQELTDPALPASLLH